MKPELTRLAGENCGGKDCAQVFRRGADGIVIQGDVVDADCPAGEAMVEIPLEVFKEAANAL
jgi:hypothetical protein